MAKSNGKTDPKLGKLVQEHLTKKGLETIITSADHGSAYEALYNGVSGFLNGMGLDINDASIYGTPKRVAEMYTEELCYGLDYDNFPKCTTTPNGTHDVVKIPDDPLGGVTGTNYRGRVDEMVMVDSIQTISLCEHHFQTITGVTHIAYIPGTQLLGLSKFARVVNFFARRPQVQERMTEQIYAALSFILETQDVAVQQVASHNCMRARGAMDPLSQTTTTKLGGRFMSVPGLRQEFLNAIPRRQA